MKVDELASALGGMNKTTSKRKVLLYFGFSRLEDILEKGNGWYVRHYEQYFDEVYVLYLLGHYPNEVRQGETRLVSLGGRNRWGDLLLAPWRLARFARELGTNSVFLLTADMVFSWWTAWWVKRKMRRKIVLLPVCIPEQLYQDNKISLSGMPIWLERLFVRYSFYCADVVHTARAFGMFVDWLQGNPSASHKLIITNSIPEAVPSGGFFDRLAVSPSTSQLGSDPESVTKLIYVGRLHHEKLVGDLFHMMRFLSDCGFTKDRVRLCLVGGGEEQEALEGLAKELQVDDRVDFIGPVKNEQLPDYLLGSDIFVSPLTGSSLREAALCGLPVVAYDRDWVQGLLEDGKTAMLVPSRDAKAMAEAVMRLIEDKSLRDQLGVQVRRLAEDLWSLNNFYEDRKTSASLERIWD